MAFFKKRVSFEQLEALAEILENCPQLARGFSRSAEGRHSSHVQWELVAKELNSIEDGCHKTAKDWSKYWIDYKARIKAKVFHKKSLTSTSPSVELVNSFNSFEERIIKLLGDDSGLGSPAVSVDAETENIPMAYKVKNEIIMEFEDVSDPTTTSTADAAVVQQEYDYPEETETVEQPDVPSVASTDATHHRKKNAHKRRSRQQTSLDESRSILSEIESKRVKAETLMAESVRGITRHLEPLLAIQERLAIAAERRAVAANNTAATVRGLSAQLQHLVESEDRRATAAERSAAAQERIAAAQERRAAAEEHKLTLQDNK